MTTHRSILISGISTLALVVIGFGTLAAIASWHLPPALTGFIAFAGLQSIAGFCGLLWAIPRSNRAFYTIFVADALLRFFALGVLAYWLWINHLSYTGSLLVFAAASVSFLFVQIPFFAYRH